MVCQDPVNHNPAAGIPPARDKKTFETNDEAAPSSAVPQQRTVWTRMKPDRRSAPRTEPDPSGKYSTR
jgi:hypothetical protein